MAFAALEPTDFPWFDYRRYTFSLGLDLGGGAAILSGHTASQYDRELRKIVVAGGLGDQVRTAYAKIEAILGAGGSGLADVVRVVEYVRHDALDDYAEIERVRRELLPSTPVVDVVPVRALLRPDALLEVEVTARRHEDDDPLAGVVYLPSIVAPADGDIATQTRAALDEAVRLLAEHGLGEESIAKITQYVPADAVGELPRSDEARRDRLGPAGPALTQVPVDRLRDPRSLVQIDVIASALPLRVVETATGGSAVVAGRVVFLSGQGGRAGDVVAQSEAALSSLDELLAAAGTDASSLVKTVEYTAVEGLAGYRGVAEVRARHLAEPWPASTGLVQPRLRRDGQLIEVDALAVLPA